MTGELDPDQLGALGAAVSEGTFEAAAAALHVTPSAVSQRIKALETRVGRVLLVRSKPIVPTGAGEILLRAARQLEAISADAIAELGVAEDTGRQTVSLAVNADSLGTWLLPALVGASAARPDLDLDLRRADQGQTAALLRDGSVMAAVTASGTAVPGCSVRALGAMRYWACASPAFVRRWLADGGTTDELALAPVLRFDRDDDLQDRYLRARTRRALTPPRHYIPGNHAFAQAISLGLGWGMIAEIQSAPMTATGEVVVFDPAHPVDVALYWQQWAVPSRALEHVAAAVQQTAALTLHRPQA